jgi:hypothetical protein
VVDGIFFHWLISGLMEDMTEVNTAGWSLHAPWTPTDDNIIAKTLWPKVLGIDSTEKS